MAIDRSAFEELTTWLVQTREVWGPRPFIGDPAWTTSWPALARWALARSDDEVELLEHDVGAAGWPEPASTWRTVGLELESRLVGAAPDDAGASLPDGMAWSRSVPPRKWQQIRAFLDASGPLRGDVVDWCAGKSHLGRTAARLSGAHALAVERDASLCAAGAALAERDAAQVSFVTADVLVDALPEGLARGRTLLALHACGALSDRALDVATSTGASAVRLAPCCYHKHHRDYRPRSDVGAAAGLVLGPAELHLPTTDETVADAALRALRVTQMVYRAALDVAHRAATGADGYRSWPWVARSWYEQPFDAFCARMQERFGVALPEPFDAPAALAEGGRRVARARRLGLVRGLFKRPLEVWIALDRARSLEQAGYDVTVRSFCSRATSPRNLLLVADR